MREEVWYNRAHQMEMQRWNVNRLEFIKRTGAFTASAFAGGCLNRFGDNGRYSVSILGDVHYDATERDVYHAKYRPEIPWKARVCEREFKRNAEMWRDRLPRLIRSAATARTDDAAFLLQLGDLIQGDCCDRNIHTKMLVDAEKACRTGFGDLEFRVVCGNHDIREMVTRDGDKSFDEWCGKPPVWTARQGPDAWVFVDFTRPDADGIFAALESTSGCRHLFLACHAPVSPSDGWGYYWFLLGDHPKYDEARRRLKRELIRRNAIVLAGHVHHTSLTEWKTPEGTLTQFTANSVWTREEQKHGPQVASKPSDFGKLYIDRNASDKPDEYDGKYTVRSRAEALAMVGEYKDMTAYRRWNDAGHYRLEVGPDTVDMLFYAGDSTKATRTFRLRGKSA